MTRRPLSVVSACDAATAQENPALLQILDQLFGDVGLNQDLVVVLALEGRHAGRRQRRSAEDPRVTGHGGSPAVAVVDLDDGVPFLDPVRLREFVERADLTNSKAAFADLCL